ncbi:MAG: 30S ribosomal protein THX [Flavobacteriales bacterium]|jgi:ribosomal small subunit protein bTHX|nr:30S ribosomal protein THX [Flavobacteriaceae bacterium]MDO7581160.1 30S ribosomal protein THX [Flavobacteriaceae bacterium]MDO7591796.1 30S ribosomal protein THX [Flavobacteriaceae bacterium]MDO7599807.1 30S ribosomal protein THX [Flavobacteriaceae bacterium]MDO7603719.1 30S ribosomal protein THX [Flavobacteriaceae bacterium]|tara:strand:+ start:924 stop:1028 length:105 start_codon:yes stop_codon:yes gene_type:complete
MGKGDKKTRRGKINLGTSGVTRNRKDSKKKRAKS